MRYRSLPDLDPRHLQKGMKKRYNGKYDRYLRPQPIGSPSWNASPCLWLLYRWTRHRPQRLFGKGLWFNRRHHIRPSQEAWQLQWQWSQERMIETRWVIRSPELAVDVEFISRRLHRWPKQLMNTRPQRYLAQPDITVSSALPIDWLRCAS